MHARRWWSVLGIVSLAWVAACAGGADSAPVVSILSPPDQHTIQVGESVQVETRVRDDAGIREVELRVNGVHTDLASVPQGEKSYRAVQHWTPSEGGIYRLTVIATDNKGQASAPAGVTVVVEPLPMPQPPTTVEPQSAPVTTVQPADCRYNATFVADVTIPDKTHLAPGAEFVKTWRLRNTGTCDWGLGFQLAFVDGERMDSPEAVEVSPTSVGNEVEVSVRFQAPNQEGTYRSRWRMRTPDGNVFGDRPFVLIVVP